MISLSLSFPHLHQSAHTHSLTSGSTHMYNGGHEVHECFLTFLLPSHLILYSSS